MNLLRIVKSNFFLVIIIFLMISPPLIYFATKKPMVELCISKEVETCKQAYLLWIKSLVTPISITIICVFFISLFIIAIKNLYPYDKKRRLVKNLIFVFIILLLLGFGISKLFFTYARRDGEVSGGNLFWMIYAHTIGIPIIISYYIAMPILENVESLFWSYLDESNFWKFI